MAPIKINVATRINGGLRFGPVCPLIDRRDSFRGQYIAVMGVEHASSVRHNLSDMIMIMQGYISELETVLPPLTLPIEELNCMAAIRGQMIPWGTQHFEDRLACPFPTAFEELTQAANYMALNYVEGENARMIRAMVERSVLKQSGIRSLKAIADQIDYMRDVFEDRNLFMKRQSGAQTVSFEMIKTALAILPEREGVGLQIEDRGGGSVGVQMPEHRLFSLFNNIIANGIIHGNKEVPIRIVLDAEAGLRFSVTNAGQGIDPKYFELTNGGYPRLFTLEKRWDEQLKEFRVPIGSAEIWDIIAISNGGLQVDTSENSTTISGFIPEAIAGLKNGRD